MKRPRLIKALIDRVHTYYRMRFTRLATPTRDWSERDYAYWDKARRSQARGLELSGLFLKPLASKVAAYVLGTMPRWRGENPRNDEVLADWWARNHADMIRALEEAVGLGMDYVVINPDLSVTLLPPNVVEPIVSDDDFSEIVGWRVREIHPHPTRPGDSMTIIDTYTATERAREISRGGAVISTERYPNLLGRLPIVPIANNRGVNEIFGNPEGVATLPLLRKYGEVLEAALNGNVHQGRPTPVATFDTVEQMEAFWTWAQDSGLVERTTQTLDDGTTETTVELRFDSDNLMMLAGAKFDWAQPGSFAGDTQILLGLLFYLFLEHTEIPEFVWGSAIASSKASAESQLPPFIKWIEKKRGEIRPWMLEVSRVVLAYSALWERGITDAEPSYSWEPLSTGDGTLTVEAVQWAYAEGLLDRKTALGLLPLDIDDVDAVLATAATEADARRAAQTAPTTAPDDLNMPQFREAELRAEQRRAEQEALAA